MFLATCLQVNDRTKSSASMHIFESLEKQSGMEQVLLEVRIKDSYLVDFCERHMTSDKFVKFHVTSEIFFHKLGNGITGFISPKGCASPHSTGHQLERARALNDELILGNKASASDK